MSKSKRKNKKSEEFIHLKDAIYISRISPRKMHELLALRNIKIYKNYFSHSILKKSDFKKLAYSNKIIDAQIEAVYFNTKKRLFQEAAGSDTKYLNELKKHIELYDKYIDDLKNIHEKYKDKIDVLRDETALCAAYILYAKVINLLKMANLCFSNLFWDSKILIRPIDEAVMLAEYFIITDGSEKGKKHLKEWFRENRSPSNAVCREAISNYMKSILPNFYDSFKRNISELYSIKSKSIHHTLNSILEIYHFTLENDNVKPVGFDFGRCTYTSKMLEMVKFFQSSIWTAFQGFFICFNTSMPLTKEDADLLSILRYKSISKIN